MGKQHTTRSDIGQLCTGEPCGICNTCSECGRVLNNTAHVLVCACPPGTEHTICTSCLALCDEAVAEETDEVLP